MVEMPEPVNRTAIFDPGMMSEPLIDVESLKYLDDIFITHVHGDHVSVPLLRKLIAKFPTLRITTTDEVVKMLAS
jgi:phosphoribosyl 1,2-cyclic phosphodiesterase